MKETFERLRATRRLLSRVVDGLSMEELNRIPDGFNNNIAWNALHILATQQILTLKLGGLPYSLDEEFINSYRKGTRPEDSISQAYWEKYISQALSTIDELEALYNSSKFKTYEPYETSYGYTIPSIEDAIAFNTVHESLHIGYIMSLKRTLNS